jgi:hypothetical protein
MHYDLIALDIVSQIGIVITGVTSNTLLARKNKWGMVVGLVSQPFWIYTTIYHHQWWMFILTFFYDYNWIVGIKHWFRKEQVKNG